MTTTTSVPTIQISRSLDVPQRLSQLHRWRQSWQAQDKLLNQRLEQLDPNKHSDIQRGEQIIRLQQRLRLSLVKKPIEVSSALVSEVGYESLRQTLCAQFARLTKAERLLWLNNFLFIMTPDLRRLNDKIAKVRAYRSFGQQRNFLLGGPSGMGKTTYLDWFAFHHIPQVEAACTHVPIIKIDAPVSNKSPKPLFQRMILECGMTYSFRDSEEELLLKLMLFLHRCRTELLIVDEVEHITRPAIRRRLLEVSNLTRGIPMICASCHPLNWSAGDPEVAGRWNDYFELRQYTGQRLQQLLAFIELLLPFTQPSFLALRTISGGDKTTPVTGTASLIERCTGGILRDIMMLIIDASARAIEQNCPSLSPSLLQESWRDIQTSQVTDFLDAARRRQTGDFTGCADHHE
ncbi:MAG: TniB family NTP-binding protein [Anaerolineae bacterium]